MRQTQKPTFEFTWLTLAFSVIEAMANELRRAEKTRPLQPAEAMQLATLEKLSEALRADLPQQGEPEFSEAFVPFIELFEEVNIATRAGGIPDLLSAVLTFPAAPPWRPFPIAPGSI